jgi:hypothetical protein
MQLLSPLKQWQGVKNVWWSVQNRRLCRNTIFAGAVEHEERLRGSPPKSCALQGIRKKAFLSLVLVTNTPPVTAPSRPCSECFAGIGYPLAKDLNDLMVCTWLGLCLASLIISLVSFWRRGLVGFCFGLLCMLGGGLCYFFIWGFFVAFEPGGPFQRDSIMLNGLGLAGLALFITGARFGLRHKQVKS